MAAGMYDYATGDPLPQHAFWIQYGEDDGYAQKRIEVWTDAEGRFETSKPILGGKLRISSKRPEGEAVKDVHHVLIDDPGAEPLVIEIKP